MIKTCWLPLFEKHNIDIDKIYNSKEKIYPLKENVYRVFEMDVNDIIIVLLGQDPYHTPDMATGLSFSVPQCSKIPPSLKNIYKEINRSFPNRLYEFKSGSLDQWFTREKYFY